MTNQLFSTFAIAALMLNSYADLKKTIFYKHAIGSGVLDDVNTSMLCVNVVSFTTDNYTLDYDGYIVANTKADNAYNYKRMKDITCSILSL